MKITQSWKKNIEMLQPQNLKKLGLLSLKLIKDNIAHLIIGYISFRFIVILFFVGIKTIFGAKSFFDDKVLLILPWTVNIVWILIFAVIIRSSVMKKNIHYYWSLFYPRLIPILSGILFYILFCRLLYELLQNKFYIVMQFISQGNFDVSIFLLMSLFFFDRERIAKFSIIGLVRQIDPTVKMMLYNLPLFAAIFIGITLLTVGINILLLIFTMSINSYPTMIPYLLGGAIKYSGLVFIVTIYNTLIYGQRSLYFRD